MIQKANFLIRRHNFWIFTLCVNRWVVVRKIESNNETGEGQLPKVKGQSSVTQGDVPGDS